MATIQSGDYTRTIIEGYWDGPSTEEGVQTDADQWEFKSAVGDKVTVEKIEPPVEVFQPGDTVRNRTGARSTLLLADRGFVNLTTNRFHIYGGYPPVGEHIVGNGGRYTRAEDFTSGRYERVELVEKPF